MVPWHADRDVAGSGLARGRPPRAVSWGESEAELVTPRTATCFARSDCALTGQTRQHYGPVLTIVRTLVRGMQAEGVSCPE